MKRYDVHTTPSWSPEKRFRFLAWLNDELSKEEDREFLNPAQRIEARSDETRNAAQPEGREPDGEADAPKGVNP